VSVRLSSGEEGGYNVSFFAPLGPSEEEEASETAATLWAAYEDLPYFSQMGEV
jgi:hypothetical protein